MNIRRRIGSHFATCDWAWALFLVFVFLDSFPSDWSTLLFYGLTAFLFPFIIGLYDSRSNLSRPVSTVEFWVCCAVAVIGYALPSSFFFFGLLGFDWQVVRYFGGYPLLGGFMLVGIVYMGHWGIPRPLLCHVVLRAGVLPLWFNLAILSCLGRMDPDDVMRLLIGLGCLILYGVEIGMILRAGWRERERKEPI